MTTTSIGQLDKVFPHKEVAGGDQMEEWIRLTDKEIPGCRIFVRPTSYHLMDAEERDRKWLEDAKAGRGSAALWVAVMKTIHK